MLSIGCWPSWQPSPLWLYLRQMVPSWTTLFTWSLKTLPLAQWYSSLSSWYSKSAKINRSLLRCLWRCPLWNLGSRRQNRWSRIYTSNPSSSGWAFDWTHAEVSRRCLLPYGPSNTYRPSQNNRKLKSQRIYFFILQNLRSVGILYRCLCPHFWRDQFLNYCHYLIYYRSIEKFSSLEENFVELLYIFLNGE